MRIWLAGIAVFLAAAVLLPRTSWAQSKNAILSTTKPDAMITVRKHASGTDLVEVTMQSEEYPAELLKAQVIELGRLLNSEPTGLRVGAYDVESDPPMRFLQATFAVRGLITPETGVLRLEPFAKAFAGAPKPHQVDGLMIQFEGVKPTERTLYVYRPKTGSVQVQAAVPASDPPMIEYRIQLGTQDPAAITIPDDPSAKPAVVAQPPKASNPAMDPILIGAFALGLLALGALVYSLLLRARPADNRSKRA
jgi:hypothetical protein